MKASKRETELFLKCQYCMQWVSLADAEGSSDFFGNYDTTKVIHPSDNASCFHISFSFYDTFDGTTDTPCHSETSSQTGRGNPPINQEIATSLRSSQ